MVYNEEPMLYNHFQTKEYHMKNHRIIFLAQCAVIISLLCVSALIRIPFPLVPLSLQTLIVMLSALILGSKKTAISVTIYILMGLLGLPVFATGGGFSYVLKPTFGYLIGMVPSAYLVGKIGSGGKSFRKNLIACSAGTALIYLFGVPYFYWIANHVMGLDRTLTSILYSGFIITLPGDILKALSASAAASKMPNLQ